jgi:hypothetical protein
MLHNYIVTTLVPISVAVCCKTVLTCVSVRLGFTDKINAATPETCGHAADVPPKQFV